MNILIKYGSWPVIILPYCVFILSPNMYQFATPWKMVTYVFLTFFHPSTACLRVMSHVYSAFIFFCVLLVSIDGELETRFVCVYTVYRIIFWTPYRPD